MYSVGKTDIGQIRKINQDYYINLQYSNIAVVGVADGLGGHKAGEVASSSCGVIIKDYFDKLNKNVRYEDINKYDIERLIYGINNHIYNKSIDIEDYSGMGTTLTLCVASNEKAIIYHVGDSRAYLVNENVIQITKDHSLIQCLIDSGEISKKDAQSHPNKHVITRAIGTNKDVIIDKTEISLKTNDVILICSDGLTNTISEDFMIEVISKYNDNLDKAVGILINQANKNGGDDNITVVLFKSH